MRRGEELQCLLRQTSEGENNEEKKLCQLYANAGRCADQKTEEQYSSSGSLQCYHLIREGHQVCLRGQRMFPPQPMQDAAMFSRVADHKKGDSIRLYL